MRDGYHIVSYSRQSLMVIVSTYSGVNVSLAECLKCESTSRNFQPGEGTSRGLLRDCENFADLRCWL